MEFIAKIFRNKSNNQISIAVPRKLDPLRIDKLPDKVKVKISIPKSKDFLGKAK